MEWNYELTEQQACELYAQVCRDKKTSARILWLLAAITAAVSVWVGVQAVNKLWYAPGAFHPAYDPTGGVTFGLLALLMAALTVWLLVRSRPRTMAAGALRQMERQGRPLTGRWHLHLDEQKLVYTRAGSQEACDPSVIERTVCTPRGMIIYLYHGAQALLVPMEAFGAPAGEPAGEDTPQKAMEQAAAEFERCAALAKARLYESAAQRIAEPEARPELPPCPPLPEGEVQRFAVPVLLQPEEVHAAFYAANRRLNPVGKRRIVTLWVLLAAAVLEAATGFAGGDWTLGAIMTTLALALAGLLIVLSPAAQRGAVRRQLAGEQLQRLTQPGWLVLGESGFTATSGALCSYRPYERLGRVAQDEDYLFLRFEGNMITAVPKRGFESPEKAQEAFAFLQSRQNAQKNK